MFSVWTTISLLLLPNLLQAQEYDVSYDSQECPTKAELDKQSGIAELHQLNSTFVTVKWSHLWPSITEWPSICVKEFQIVINDQPVLEYNDADDIVVVTNSNNAVVIDSTEKNIQVPSCEELEIKVRLKVVDTENNSDNNSQEEEEEEDWISSDVNPQNRTIRTYKSPQFKKDAKINVEYIIDNANNVLDLQSISVKGSFYDIVEDFECRRVEKIELMVRKIGSNEWMFVQDFENIQILNMEVTGLVDFCASYEIALRLHGTEGTTPAEQILVTLKPVKSNNDLLLRAKSSGYQFEIKKTDTIPNVDVFYKTKNSIVLHWNNTTEENDDVCFDGYHIKLLDENDCTHLEQLVPNEMEMALFTGLNSCTQYYIYIKYYLGKEDSNKDDVTTDEQTDDPKCLKTKKDFIFGSQDLKILQDNAKTLPELSTPFELKNVQASIQQRSLHFVWNQADLDECISVKDLKVSICQKYLERGSCFQVKEGRSNEFKVIGNTENTYSVGFKQLQPCANYHILFEHGFIEKTTNNEKDDDFYDQDQTDDFFIDNNPIIDNPNSWGVVWYSVKTKFEEIQTAPENFQAIEVNETAIKLQWKKDHCVEEGYNVWYSLTPGFEEYTGSKYKKIDPVEDTILDNPNILVNDESLDLSMIMEEGSGDFAEGSGAGELYDLDDSGDYDDGSSDYDTDNEDFGSGDRDSAEHEELFEYLTEVANDLEPCTTYHFKIVDLSQLGLDTIKAAETTAKTDCEEITTTTEIPSQIIDDVTDINIEPLEAISNVTLAQAHDPDQGTKLTLNWNSNPDVKVVIVFESQPLGFYVERESPGDTLFLNIPSGQVFNVSFKAVYPNGNFSVKWEKSINTEINPGDKFEDALKDLAVYTESDENGKGKSFLKWQHTLNYGLERYAIKVEEEEGYYTTVYPKKGEAHPFAPKPNTEGCINLAGDNCEMSIDLNSLPGLLDLENCQTYRAFIYPNSFPRRGSDLENDNSSSIWSRGYSKDFIYEDSNGLVPNQVNLSQIISFELTQDSLTLLWKERFACRSVDIKIIQKPFLYKNQSHHEQIVLEIIDYQGGDPIDISKLVTCMTHRWEIFVGNILIFFQDFKTLKNGDTKEHLMESEVIVWKDANENDYEVIALEWADRCQDQYRLDICLFPYSCSQSHLNELQGFQFRTFGVTSSGDGGYPKQAVTDLLPCSFYTYEISTSDQSFLFYNGSFQTTFSMEDFDLNLHDFSVVNDTHGLAINASWTHVHPCISSYNVTLIDSASQTELNEMKVEAPAIMDHSSNTRVYVYFDDNLKQCTNYDFIIRPLVNVSTNQELHEDDKRKFTGKNILLFNEPVPPEEFKVLSKMNNDSKDDDDQSVTLQWSHLPCYDFYELTGILDTDQTQIFKRTINTTKNTGEKMTYQISEELNPCSSYSFLLRSGSHEIGVSKDEVGLVHFTKHADEIIMTHYADYYQIIIDVELHGMDCVSRYKLVLCENENQHFIPVCYDSIVMKKGNVTFTGLQDGKDFEYHLIGYNDIYDETWRSEFFSVKTKFNVTAKFTVNNIDDKSATLDFYSSIFDRLDEFNLTSYTILASCNYSINSDEFYRRQVSNTKVITLENLKPYSSYECRGQFSYKEVEETEEFYPIEVLKFETAEGVPDHPVQLTIDKISVDGAMLEWKQPENRNGIIDNYKIEITKNCPEYADSEESNEICHDVPCKDETFSIISKEKHSMLEKLRPWTVYSVKVAGKTEHPNYGNFSEPIRFKSLAGNPHQPEILKTSQTRRGGLVIDFNYPCPLTGNTTFHAKFKSSVAHLNLKNVTTITHRPLTIELVGLEGGHFYDVWIEACVDKKCSKSKSVVFEIECEHRCSDGTCIHFNAKCNYIRECPDGSDEIGCPCDPPLYFRCSNSYCIPSWRQCDGVNDCNDMSDETSCPSCIADNEFRCQESGECLPRNKTCDRRVDCRDGSDESGCPYWRTSCWPEKFRCLTHKCVDMKFRCDKIWDCEGGEDELSCNNNCRNGGQFACRNRNECVAMSRYCDGVADCSDGSDEAPECRCHKRGQYACNRGGHCISRESVCDGVYDCPDHSDEQYKHCKSKNATLVALEDNLEESPGENPEEVVKQTIITSHQEENILYQEIEAPKFESANLIEETPKHLVRVYPKSQSVYKKTDVVIQCRDEGYLRSKVKWSRIDGGKMPKHTRQKKGRLEIRNIGLHEGGLYICQVIGHSNEKGTEEIAQVDVMKYHH